MSDPNPEQVPPPAAPPAAAYPPPPAQTPPPAAPPVGAYPPPAYGAAPPAYGTTPPGYPAAGYTPYPAPPKTNTLAIVSLICSIASFVIVPFLGSVAGVITGHISLKQLKTSGESGRGLALTGTILGWVGIGLSILLAIFIFVIIGLAGAGAWNLDYSSYSSSS